MRVQCSVVVPPLVGNMQSIGFVIEAMEALKRRGIERVRLEVDVNGKLIIRWEDEMDA